MAVGGIPCPNVRVGERHNLAVEQGGDPANGANEPRAVRAGPDHRLRPGDFANGLWKNFFQDVDGDTSANELPGDNVFALRRADKRQLRNGDSLLLGKTYRGARGLPCRVTSDG